MLQYTFKLSHNNGTVIMRINASSLDAAIVAIEKAENCPRSAIALKSILPIPQHCYNPMVKAGKIKA